MKKWLFFPLSFLLLLGCGPQKKSEIKLLVFTKTMGYRHASIPDGQQMFMDIAKEQGWKVDTTEASEVFTDSSLQQYSAVVFLSTTGDILNAAQQVAFQRYIEAGGGFVGIHAASDTEYGWPWYGKLVGAYFDNHPGNPNVRSAVARVVKQDHPSTRFFGQPDWPRTDEFYNFKDFYYGPEDGIIPLVNLDETTYEGGTNGEFHPISWYHDFQGGRAWYTNFGHTSETYAEPIYRQHVLGGLQYAIGKNHKLDYTKVKTLLPPEPDRFSVEVLIEHLDEPGEMDFLPDGRILYTQRHGEIQLLDPNSKTVKTVGELDVFTKFEDGLVGLAVDPKYYRNQWIYLYYAPNIEESLFRLSRFKIRGDSLDYDTETIILEVPVQRKTCCHTGGSIEFGPDRMLYLSTGDDTNPFETRYAPINEKPGSEPWDAQRSSANTSDLRGKVLRIIPESDGSYAIPDGNLFPKDGSKGRPEIFVMGCRNPYRISVDPHNGWLYWGDVGPDGRKDSTRGPQGYDEINLATKAGFHGWPYFIGNNYPYQDFDFEAKIGGNRFDYIHPVNSSRNNTGLRKLPPATPPLVWYPYGQSKYFSEVEQGSRNAMAGPVYHLADYANQEQHFPPYFDGKVFAYDFMRNWVLLMTVDKRGKLEKLERFLPDLKLSSPMDMAFGPDGSLYILEYGLRWFSSNTDARLIRVSYAKGNRPPRPVIAVAPAAGSVPLTVQFDASASTDLDQETAPTFLWTFPDGSTQTGPTASFTFTEIDSFRPYLTLTDKEGLRTQQEVLILAGNAPPQLTLDLPGNQSFFWSGRSTPYHIRIQDQEDGSTEAGTLPSKKVNVSFEHLADSKDPTIGAQDHAALASQGKSPGETLLQTAGCIACHGIKEPIVGPAYTQVAQRYLTKPNSVSYLVGKIRNGGGGLWGEHVMPAMPQVSESQAKQMAQFILSLAQVKPSLPLEGTLSFDQHQGDGAHDQYTLRISYTDQGYDKMAPQEVYRELTLRSNHMLAAAETDPRHSHLIRYKKHQKEDALRIRGGGHAALMTYDLTDIQRIEMEVAGMSNEVTLEIRLDSVNGPVWGSVNVPRTDKDTYQNLSIPVKPMTGFHHLLLVPQKPGPVEPQNDMVRIWHMRVEF